MKKIIYLVICLATTPAFAKDLSKNVKRKISSVSTKLEMAKIKCSADTGGSQRESIEVQQTMGSAPDVKKDYRGNKVAVGFFPGDPYEGQQVLAIELNGFISKIYDPKKSLYILEAPSAVKVQCYIATE